ncbi:MAG: hypothetical protein ACRDO7_10610 [Nocardioidaceae bacterium]
MTSPNPTSWYSHTRPETPTYAAWAPGEGRSCGVILSALRNEGFIAQIGSRPRPAGNFEVRYVSNQADRVEQIILGVDSGATRLNVGR